LTNHIVIGSNTQTENTGIVWRTECN